ncbi:integrase core domain-containing protein [Ammonicoccus fulvus]|uniref:Integrase core domain-containing protein n=1 Tax=Ammonicoccus fulvus TaxID=3138240 RepID=A0ABZ3FPU3_9ACTN
MVIVNLRQVLNPESLHRPSDTPECVKIDGPFKTVDELELATLMWVDWYNTGRLHSSIGYVPPTEYEAAYYAAVNPQNQPVPG